MREMQQFSESVAQQQKRRCMIFWEEPSVYKGLLHFIAQFVGGKKTKSDETVMSVIGV